MHKYYKPCLFRVGLADGGSDSGVLGEGIARLQLECPTDKLLEERVVNASLDENAGAVGANFSLKVKDNLRRYSYLRNLSSKIRR